MSIKPHIANHVLRSTIRSKISPEFHKLVDDKLLRQDTYSVISFPGMRGVSSSIVDSKSLTKALRKPIPDGEGLVVVAHNFTFEARELLNSLGAVYFSASDHYWTDESWAAIRDS